MQIFQRYPCLQVFSNFFREINRNDKIAFSRKNHVLMIFSAWKKGAGEQLQFLAQLRVQDQDVA